jgi:hypothetical protein
MPDVYAVRADLFKFGGSPSELANPGRVCASVLAATNVFELDGHGFETDDLLQFRAEEGGNVPAPLVAGTTYYAIRLTETTFKVAAAAAGSAIDLTTDGNSLVVVKALPIDDVLEYYSRWADQFIPAHAVPLDAEDWPLVRGIVAKLAFKELQRLNGKTSIVTKDAELEAKAQLERWAKGLPIRGAVSGQTNLAYSERIASDARDWGSRGAII